jgi:UDP-N-acetylmuramoyl-tripeptide--D-alanyl-D-alanine ligase
VLGEMRELGAHSADAHAEIGALASQLHVDVVVGVGEQGAVITAAAAAGNVDVVEVSDATEALAALRTIVKMGDTVLLKASRAVGLEVVAAGLVGRESCGSRS